MVIDIEKSLLLSSSGCSVLLVQKEYTLNVKGKPVKKTLVGKTKKSTLLTASSAIQTPVGNNKKSILLTSRSVALSEFLKIFFCSRRGGSIIHQR